MPFSSPDVNACVSDVISVMVNIY